MCQEKDFWMTSEAGSYQPSSSETEALRNQVALLEEKLKQSNENSEKNVDVHELKVSGF
ncbi:hypothetical protein HanLR1_Chr14g0537811 [Helianthus annuus]|nr:hypothetical protein HanHA89_Chr14g0575411 [Helianthus annuus]KAJ0656608.1 hypothetical protein HanLR1_Chr14g0537811 [Helianthus annuus]